MSDYIFTSTFRDLYSENWHDMAVAPNNQGQTSILERTFGSNYF